MHRITEYILFFLGVVITQVLLFDNISVGSFVICSVYPIFVIMLPFETKPLYLLLLATLLGFVVDTLTFSSGLNCTATAALGFFRPALVSLFLGNNDFTKRGVPTSSYVPLGKFIIYITFASLLHTTILLGLETMSLFNFMRLVVRVLSTTILSTLVIFVCQLPLFRQVSKIS